MSCTFVTDGEYVSAIRPPEPVSFSIEVNDPNFSDPYYVLGSTRFTFTLRDLSKPLIGYEVIVDGGTLLTSEYGLNLNKTITFTLQPHSLTDGIHTVKIRMQIATQSGSLAERLGVEYYIAEQSFKIVLDRTTPQLPNAPEADYENGYLTLRWTALDQQNFNYTIRRYYGTYGVYKDSTFYNKGENMFIDQSYIGGDVTYELLASGYGFEQHKMGSVFFTKPPIDLQVAQDENKLVTLSWSNVEINTSNTFLSLDLGFGTSFPLTDKGSIVIDTLVMGETRSYWVDARRANQEEIYRTLHKVESYKNIPVYESFAFLVNNSKLLLCTGKAIYRYEISTLQVEDSLLATEFECQKFSSLVVNETENRAVVVGDNTYLVEFDPLDFGSSRETYSIFPATRSVTGSGDEIKSILLGNLSDEGDLTMIVSQNRLVGLLFSIIDGQVRWHTLPNEGPHFQRPPVISGDSEYLVCDIYNLGRGVVYKKQSGGYVPVAEVQKGWKFFCATSQELIVVTAFDRWFAAPPVDGRIDIYKLSSISNGGSALVSSDRSVELPQSRAGEYLKEIGYDQKSNQLYSRYTSYSISYLRLINVDNLRESETKIGAVSGEMHHYVHPYQITNIGFVEQVK